MKSRKAVGKQQKSTFFSPLASRLLPLVSPRRRVSTRLTLTLLCLTLGSLLGLSLVLDAALKNFFIQDAQASLQQQANALANQASLQWDNLVILREWAELTAQQGRVEVLVFDRMGVLRVQGEGVIPVSRGSPPPDLIRQTLAGSAQQGRFWVATEQHYPWWLYSSVPIRYSTNSQVLGAVYVSMPMRRLKQRLQQLEGFTSYRQIQQWLEQEFGKTIQYKTVHKTVRYRLKAKLKVPRPRSLEQDEQSVSLFKKTSPLL